MANDQHQFMYCPYCGAKIKVGLKFCPHCGAALTAANRMASDNKKPTTNQPKKNHYTRNIIVGLALLGLVAIVAVAIKLSADGENNAQNTPKETAAEKRADKRYKENHDADGRGTGYDQDGNTVWDPTVEKYPTPEARWQSYMYSDKDLKARIKQLNELGYVCYWNGCISDDDDDTESGYSVFFPNDIYLEYRGSTSGMSQKVCVIALGFAKKGWRKLAAVEYYIEPPYKDWNRKLTDNDVTYAQQKYGLRYLEDEFQEIPDQNVANLNY